MARLAYAILGPDGLATVVALAAIFVSVSVARRWLGKALRLMGALGGLGVVALALLAAVVIFERN